MEQVDHPSHYQDPNGRECIDIIEEELGPDGFQAFCRGNVIKYEFRAGKKGPAEQDQAKADWYARKAKETAKAVPSLSIAERELLAALGTMLSTWDEGTARMVAFMKCQTPETAKAYGDCFPKMFDAAILGRSTHDRYRHPER